MWLKEQGLINVGKSHASGSTKRKKSTMITIKEGGMSWPVCSMWHFLGRGCAPVWHFFAHKDLRGMLNVNNIPYDIGDTLHDHLTKLYNW